MFRKNGKEFISLQIVICSHIVQLVDKRLVDFFYLDLSTMIIAQQKETTLPHEENRMLQHIEL